MCRWDVMYRLSASFNVPQVLFEINCKLLLFFFIDFDIILAKKSTFRFLSTNFWLIDLKNILEIDFVLRHYGIRIERVRLQQWSRFFINIAKREIFQGRRFHLDELLIFCNFKSNGTQ